MAASLSDSAVLGGNATFISRVQESLVASAIAISSEGTGVVNHPYRLHTVHQLFQSPTSLQNFVSMFALTVPTDTTVLADATQAGTVALTTGNVATQQALVTDAHINSAVSGQFNAFCQSLPH